MSDTLSADDTPASAPVAAARPVSGAPDAAAADVTRTALFRALLLLGLLLGAVMMLAAPTSKPAWTDELISIEWGQYPLLTILQGRATPPDQPPLHPLYFWTVRTLFGDTLFVYRLASSIPAVITPWVVYLIGRRIRPEVGLLGLWLTALSPGLILFDRMTRYHSLVALFATLSVYFFLSAADRGRKRDTAFYALSTLGMLLCYFLSIFVVAAQFVRLVLRWKREKGRLLLLGGMAAACALWAPYFLQAIFGATGGGGLASVTVEDPSVGQGIGGFARRLLLPVFVYCVGETVYPWNFPVVAVGVAASLGGAALGIWAVRKRPELLVPMVWVAVLVLSALATSGKLGAAQTVGSMAKRVSFAQPLFYVTVAAGVYAIRARGARIALTAVLLLVSAYSVRNYWAGEQFLNQNYVADWPQTIAVMRKDGLGPDSLVLSNEMSLDFYLGQEKTPARTAKLGTGEEAEKLLREKPARHVWIVGRDRGDRTVIEDYVSTQRFLASRFRRVGEYGVMPRTEDEKKWLGRMMKRPAAPTYIWMERFDTASPPLPGGPVPPAGVAAGVPR